MYETNGGVAIQTLSFDELDMVGGGDISQDDVATGFKVAGGAALTGAAVVAKTGSLHVAAGLAVAGLACLVIGEGLD